MFDVVVTSAPATPFAGRVAAALREARMRVTSCEVSSQRPPPDVMRVDAAIVRLDPRADDGHRPIGARGARRAAPPSSG